MEIRLSKSTLEEFNRCARCWWLAKNHKIKAPDGIRAGVPMGIDRVLKGHYDAHRAAGTVPAELVGKIPGGLYGGKRVSMSDLRNWRKGLAVSVGTYELSTALDDMLFDPKTGLYNMIDYKSKAKLTNVEDTQKYYQTQADAYDLALNVNGYQTDGRAFFAYYAPISVDRDVTGDDTNDGRYVPFNWHAQVIVITADHARIKDLVTRAGKCLEGPLPAASMDCDMCVYVKDRKAFIDERAAAATV